MVCLHLRAQKFYCRRENNTSVISDGQPDFLFPFARLYRIQAESNPVDFDG